MKLTILPMSFELEGCTVYILETIKTKRVDGSEEYHVTVKIKWNNIESKIFSLDVKDNKELKAKLLAEISKMKLMKYILGDDLTKKIIG